MQDGQLPSVKILHPMCKRGDFFQAKNLNDFLACSTDASVKISEGGQTERVIPFYMGGNYLSILPGIRELFESPHVYREVSLGKHYHCELLGISTVITSAGKVARNCILHGRYFCERNITYVKEGITEIRYHRKHEVKVIDRPCFYISSSGLQKAYTHWFLEIFTRLSLLSCLPSSEDLTIMMDGNTLNYQREMVERAGVSSERILLKEHSVRYKVRELYLPGPAALSVWQNPVAFTFFHDMKRKLILDNVRPEFRDFSRKLYIGRKDLKWKRAFLNFNMVEPLLKQAGYKPVYPESMNIDEKMYVFSRATHVIGEAGGGLTNIVFSEPGLKLLVISSDCFPSPVYKNIAASLGFRYGYVIGTGLERPFVKYDNNTNYVVSPVLMQEALDIMESV